MSELLAELHEFWRWEGECQVWSGAHNGPKRDNRPFAMRHGKMIYVAREILAEKLGRPLLPGMKACHILECPNKSCVRPEHLFECTNSQNIQDANDARRRNRKTT